jgi:propanol-preferring alcohol dehydrogenase
MKAQIITRVVDLAENLAPLEWVDLPVPEPGNLDVLVKVSACAVCHTELDEIEGRTPPPYLPVIPGHQVIGRVAANGKDATRYQIGERVGIPWIFSACGSCLSCKLGYENLCSGFKATGRDANGGYAEYMVVHQMFAHPIPGELSDTEAAPLLCAGAVGYRALKLADLKEGQTLGLTGFGASAHLVIKAARWLHPKSPVFVFARSEKERAFARELGAEWTGASGDQPPQLLDAIIDTTPVWQPVVDALRCLAPGGRLVINAIRKEASDKPALMQIDYADHLWMEKEIKSVANVTRRDVNEFLALSARIGIRPEVELYPLEEANRALAELKAGQIRGAKVLVFS